MKPIIDIHMHVLPDVDDGSQSLAESTRMIRSSYEQGVRYAFCTSHSYMAYRDESSREHSYDMRNELGHHLFKDGYKVGIRLYMGSEVAYDTRDISDTIHKLNEGIIPTMNRTKFVLGDFWPTDFDYSEAEYVVKALLNAGYIPILAHVERYKMTSAETIKALRDMGAYIQINAYSVAEERNLITKNRAIEMLDNKLVDFIGSDAHRITHRPPMVEAGVKFMYENYDEEYIDAIVHDNAKKYLIGE